MSCRVDTTPLIAGACIVSLYPGLGIDGATMRATTGTGPNGAGILYNDWDSSADDAKEFCGLIVSGGPAGATFYEDGSFSVAAGTADGTYTVTYRLFVDGADLGTTTASITIGSATFSLTPTGLASTLAFGTPTFTRVSEFSLAVAGLSSTLALGAPSFARHVDFAAAAAGLASTLAYGAPSFSALREFSVLAAGLPSSVAFGVSSVSFAIPDPGEPVTLDEAKLAARVDGNDLDPFILGVISAARAQAEQITGRVYRRRHFRFELEAWPDDNHRFSVHEPTDCEISYWNGTAWQQLSPTAFEFAGIASGAEIAPALDTAWPALGRRAVGARVKVDFTAGPTDRDQVDAAVKLYIKAQVAAWVDNPQALSSKQVELSPLLAHLLDEQRLWS